MRDFFEVLGLPRKYHLSMEEAEQRFRELSKQLHPDRFAKAAPRERLMAVQKTTELNDAWRVLRDPVKRAEYLSKVEGFDVADEKGSVKASPALLMEMMEKNEELVEAKAAGDAARIAGLVREVESARQAALAKAGALFEKYDAGDRSVLGEIAQALVALRYHARFLEQTDTGEEARL